MKYVVPLIPKTTSMSCWAASIAMIVGWKKQMSIPDQAIAANPGGLSYMTSYKEGLDPNDKYILSVNGFSVDAPQCYMPKSIFKLLVSNGPLWVATWAPGPHIRVVTGMTGTDVHINDPAPQNKGDQYTRKFKDFFGAMEELGSREVLLRAPVYVAYLNY